MVIKCSWENDNKNSIKYSTEKLQYWKTVRTWGLWDGDLMYYRFYILVNFLAADLTSSFILKSTDYYIYAS